MIRKQLTKSSETPEVSEGKDATTEFQNVESTRRKLLASESLVLSTRGGITLSGDKTMSEYYEMYKEEDGFLYVYYMLEATFGN